MNRLVDWAMEVVALPGVSLCTYTSVDRRRFTLLPRITTEKVGLITIWNDNRKPYLSMWRSVFERRAPRSIEAVGLPRPVELYEREEEQRAEGRRIGVACCYFNGYYGI